MIQGLRLLPYVADKPTLHCHTCQHGDSKPMSRTAPTDYPVRQLRGCPYLPQVAGARPLFEVPEADMDADEVAVCPGFSIGLPEVAETVEARPDWLKGYLAEWFGEEPTPLALKAQKTLDGAINAKQASDSRKRAEEAKNHGQ